MQMNFILVWRKRVPEFPNSRSVESKRKKVLASGTRCVSKHCVIVGMVPSTEGPYWDSAKQRRLNILNMQLDEQ